MKKNILYLILFLHSFLLFGQDPIPYFMNYDFDDIADGNFENPDNCEHLICTEPIKARCAYWDPYDPSGNITFAKIHSKLCISIDESQDLLIDKYFCSILASNSSSYTEKILGRAVNLLPGRTYTIKFYQRNLYDELDLGDIGEPGSSAKFKITFGSNVVFSDLMTYPPSTLLFEEQEFDFIANTTSEVFSIEGFPYITDLAKINTRLAIDGISITLKPLNEDEEPIDPIVPIDPVEVPQPCRFCTSFELTRNEIYVFSGWVKQTKINYDLIDVISYENSFIEIDFDNAPGNLHVLNPSGEIIDGWQKISKTIMIPSTANEINIRLRNTGENLAFFDDIRVHPFNSNLKSFVYDQQTQRLMAELDENNYATFYEYDQEGGLVRVKKETEKGVFTIQETRSSTIKRNNN